ncbi:hypothetical protein ACQP1W_33085 [Spirillospora sp. CA-255316]
MATGESDPLQDVSARVSQQEIASLLESVRAARIAGHDWFQIRGRWGSVRTSRSTSPTTPTTW